MADDGAVLEMESNKQRLPFERPQVLVPSLGLYTRCSSSSTTFEKDYRCFMGTWVREGGREGGVQASLGMEEKKASLAAKKTVQIRARGVSFG